MEATGYSEHGIKSAIPPPRTVSIVGKTVFVLSTLYNSYCNPLSLLAFFCPLFVFPLQSSPRSYLGIMSVDTSRAPFVFVRLDYIALPGLTSDFWSKQTFEILLRNHRK